MPLAEAQGTITKPNVTTSAVKKLMKYFIATFSLGP